MDHVESATRETGPSPQCDATAALPVPHVYRGRTVVGNTVTHVSRDLGKGFCTPAIDLDDLVWPRAQAGPAFDLPIAQVTDFLVELGPRLHLDVNQLMQQALESMIEVSPLGRRILENCYRDIPNLFSRSVIEDEVRLSLGEAGFIDGWVPRTLRGRPSRLRAFPPRLVHILAGNSPMVAAMTVMRAALTKGVHLLKLPSNDLFTATAILRTMAEIDPAHPLTQSFSAAYWRGGDENVESILYRPQYFDKLVVWGGESAVRHAMRYAGPGLELVAFDPKVSISLIGREAFASDELLKQVARAGAADVQSFNQDACNASRYQFIEGNEEDADRYCEHLAAALGEDFRYGDGQGPLVPADIREAVDVLREMEPLYRVFGGYDGKGLVIRSDERVDFHPICKTVNVVPVQSLRDATRFATVATQTVGIYPPHRVVEVRDALACAGVQRIVTLGESISDGVGGYPHDGMFPIHRFMKWISEEAGDVAEAGRPV
ncbi:acyl-CoA reductase [Paraburkholderia madseniana]|uniref:Long-chain-fatty-acyl-CoA reductase n=1 Tax=Paraburkholderia madseniana TaxID=2599607 RepID=A0AAP5BFJ4_9BURK|nr:MULTISPECIES: acyl-CoA reductase [Paraburkholderia]MCX4147808.1 long-chain-fatty-acyl-CoA reductase [Paraburkholderia madseniana]MDN7150750.1 long-chain-fatty-acyl-CoA reductase [Paraburkholderia sp. WS6]MDQ6409630.1 long-chain-fatty-acyl-CoA reductase [Paraburkholderia madseniana]